MLGQPCAYDRQQHRIIHPHIEKWIKRQVPVGKLRDSLFVYYHNLYGTFVIAQWIAPKKSFIDVLNMGTTLYNFDQDMAEEFLQGILSPVSSQEMADSLKRGESNRLSRKQDSTSDRAERMEQIKSTKLSVSLTGP